MSQISDTAATAREIHRACDGKFGTQPAAESDTDLASHAPEWGDVSAVKPNGRSPWGEIQYADHIAPGIASVGTAGHGGIKLSPERNRHVPAGVRRASGWYEEDCEQHAVCYTFPEEMAGLMGDAERTRSAAVQGLRDWYPQECADLGIDVDATNSLTLRLDKAAAEREAVRRANTEQFVTTSDRNFGWVPDTHRVITATQESTGTTRHLLAPRSFWSDHGTSMTNTPIVVDPDSYVDVTDLVEQDTEFWQDPGATAEPVHDPDQWGYDPASLTPTQRERSEAELAKVWRFTQDDGSQVTRSLRDQLAAEGVRGKSTSRYGEGKREYVLQVGPTDSSTVRPVSAATYNAMGGVPDHTRERTRVHGAFQDAARRRAKSATRQAHLDFIRARQAKEELETREVAEREAHGARMAAELASRMSDTGTDQ